jgi:LysM repeat protein
MQNKKTNIERKEELKELLKRLEIASGKSAKVIASELGVDVPVWSRIKALHVNFPVLKIKQFIQICGTDELLRWIAEDCGYTLVKNTKTNDEQARDTLEKIQDALDFLKKHFKD